MRSVIRQFARSVQSFGSQTRSISSSIPRRSVGIVQHRETDDNRSDAKWDFTSENHEKIKKILAKYPTNYKRSGIMPLLTLAQEQNQNWLPVAAMNRIAEMLEVPPMRVYEVATFYSMYNRTPIGKYHIQLCGTSPCMVRGSEEIAAAMEKHLGIKMGETTPDGLFTLQEVECLGACVNAPMLQINNHEFYEHLNPQSTVKLLDDLKAGRPVKEGNQNHIKTCEGPMGKTTLFTEVEPVCRDFDKLKVDYEAAQKAEKEKAAAAAAAAAAQKK